MNTRFLLLSAGIAFVCLSLCASDVLARDTMQTFPIQTVLDLGKGNGKLGGDIAFYFSDQPHPAIEAPLSRGVVTNKKTNSLNKSDVEACNQTMLSALIELQERARREGGNAVVNIASYYKNNRFESRDEFQCAGGNIMNGVALIGDVVKLKR